MPIQIGSPIAARRHRIRSMLRIIWGIMFVTLAACSPPPVQYCAIAVIFAYAVRWIVGWLTARFDRHSRSFTTSAESERSCINRR